MLSSAKMPYWTSERRRARSEPRRGFSDAKHARVVDFNGPLGTDELPGLIRVEASLPSALANAAGEVVVDLRSGGMACPHPGLAMVGAIAARGTPSRPRIGYAVAGIRRRPAMSAPSAARSHLPRSPA
ncbi:MAG: hypothetical protein GY835_04885 [bacterium]|nr:hypothetical protein [bacterium]